MESRSRSGTPASSGGNDERQELLESVADDIERCHTCGTEETKGTGNACVSCVGKQVQTDYPIMMVFIRRLAERLPNPADRCELHGAPKVNDSHHECGCEVGKPACLSVRQELEALRENAVKMEQEVARLRGYRDSAEASVSHPDTTRILKVLVQRVGGGAMMTEHDRKRADSFQLRWTDNGHTLSVLAVPDT